MALEECGVEKVGQSGCISNPVTHGVIALWIGG